MSPGPTEHPRPSEAGPVSVPCSVSPPADWGLACRCPVDPLCWRSLNPPGSPVPSASYTHAGLSRHGDQGGRTPALTVGTETPGGLTGRKATALWCSGREMVSPGLLHLGPGCSPAQWTGSDGDNSVGGDNSTPGAFPDCPRHQECGWLQGHVQCSLSPRQDQGPSGSGPAKPQLLWASLCQSGGRDQRPPGPGLSDTDSDSATGSLIAAQRTSPRGSGVAQARTFPKAPFSEQNSGTGGESLCVITIAGRVPLLGPGAVIWAPTQAPGLAQKVRGSPGSSVTMYGLVCSV